MSEIKFLLFIILYVLLPGYLVVRNSKFEKLAVKFFVSISLGLVSFTAVFFLFSLLNVRFLTYLYPLPFLIYLVASRKQINFKFKKRSVDLTTAILTLLIVLGTVFQCLAVFRSGLNYDFGIGYWGPLGHDGIWHEALIGQIIKSIPPNNPGFSGSTLSSYHYFFDVLVAGTTLVTNISVRDLLYRCYPACFSILLGLGSYLLSLSILKTKPAALLSTYFVYFAGSFGWIVSLMKGEVIGGESAFWMNQPVSMNLNPPFAISLVLLIAFLFLFFGYGRRQISLLPLLIVSGFVFQFKSYAGVVIISTVLGVFIYQAIFKKDYYLAKYSILLMMINCFLIMLLNKNLSGIIQVRPFWFVDTMIDFPDRVGWLKLSMAREAYRSGGIWWKYILAEVLSLAIFIIGNIGFRVLAMVVVVGQVLSKEWKNPRLLTIYILGAISIFIPLVFVQKGNTWNTIQFGYYFLFVLSILGGGIVNYLVKIRKIFVSLPALVLMLLVAPVSAFATFKSGLYPRPPSAVPPSELVALSYLKSLPDGVVLTPNYNSNLRGQFSDIPYPLYAYETTCYVSAYTGKVVYLADEMQQEILGNEYISRTENMKNFFSGSEVNWKNTFLMDSDIKYVYLPKGYGFKIASQELKIKKVFDNEAAEIYEVSF